MASFYQACKTYGVPNLDYVVAILTVPCCDLDLSDSHFYKDFHILL
jgi:hypothetical protein